MSAPPPNAAAVPGTPVGQNLRPVDHGILRCPYPSPLRRVLHDLRRPAQRLLHPVPPQARPVIARIEPQMAQPGELRLDRWPLLPEQQHDPVAIRLRIGHIGRIVIRVHRVVGSRQPLPSPPFSDSFLHPLSSLCTQAQKWMNFIAQHVFILELENLISLSRCVFRQNQSPSVLVV